MTWCYAIYICDQTLEAEQDVRSRHKEAVHLNQPYNIIFSSKKGGEGVWGFTIFCLRTGWALIYLWKMVSDNLCIYSLFSHLLLLYLLNNSATQSFFALLLLSAPSHGGPWCLAATWGEPTTAALSHWASVLCSASTDWPLFLPAGQMHTAH